MNVLLANDASLERSGIALFMLQWSKGIKKAYPDSIIHIYFREGIKSLEVENECIEMGIHIHIGNIPRHVNFKNKNAREKVEKDIKEIIQREKINVIHVNSGVFGYNFALLFLAKRLGVPVRVAHSHGPYPERFIDKCVHLFLRRSIRNNATALAGCSKAAGEYLFGKAGVKSNKWNFIPNTISVDRFVFNNEERDIRRKEIKVGEGELLLGAVGYLTKVKNHTFLIDVLHDLIENGIPTKLIILGEGKDREKLQKKSIALGVEDCLILYGSTQNVPGWLSAMDYYLMPSLSEGFPISAIEAQTSGLPCLFSDRISTEVDLTESVWHLSIDNGIKDWVNTLRHVRPASVEKRAEAAEIIKNLGFDEAYTPTYVRSLYNIKSL